MQLRFSKIQEQQNLQLYIFCQYAFDNKGSTKLTRTENDRQETTELLQASLLANINKNDLSSINYHARACHAMCKRV